jgi:LytS/YehU family sensor histidine kinase
MKMFDIAFITFSSLGFLFLQKWDESASQKLKLIESLSEAEVIFLRSQMSPHFLLNTLNSIYSLALNKSPEIYPAISELKNIYSYVQREQGKVSLNDEILYLQNFIKMQKRRFGESVAVNVLFSVDKDYQLEPLLLSSFIENAFKHGISMKEHSYINIKLLVYDGKLEYEVENSNHSLKNKDLTSGIGLKNLSRRLELLYPANYFLRHFCDSQSYTAVLTIQNL